MEDFFSIPQSIPTQQSPCHALLSGSSQSSFNCRISGACMVHLWYFTGTVELPTWTAKPGKKAQGFVHRFAVSCNFLCHFAMFFVASLKIVIPSHSWN